MRNKMRLLPALSSEMNVTRFICEVGGEIIVELELFVNEILSGGNTAPPPGAAAFAAAGSASPVGTAFSEDSTDP